MPSIGQRSCPRLPAKRTTYGRAKIDANDPTETWATLASRSAKLNHCAPFRWSLFLLNPHDARESALLTRVKHLQLGNAIVGAAEPPTKLAVDILHHHHIRIDVGLVARVEFSGRELVQHGWALRDDGG